MLGLLRTQEATDTNNEPEPISPQSSLWRHLEVLRFLFGMSRAVTVQKGVLRTRNGIGILAFNVGV